MAGLSMVPDVLYQLKREFGLPLTIVQRTSSSPNLETGKMTVTKDSVFVNRAIALPDRLDRDFEYDLTFIASNKNFTYGGFYDKRRRRFIIDRKDLPNNFKIEIGNYLVFDGKRYEAEIVQEFEKQAGYLIVAKQETNVELENLIKRVLISTFLPTQTVQVEKQ